MSNPICRVPDVYQMVTKSSNQHGERFKTQNNILGWMPCVKFIYRDDKWHGGGGVVDNNNVMHGEKLR